jgi:cytochrome c peroxidase
MDNCVSKPDPMNFKVGSVNVRRVEPRNTPTMINAMFTNRNFWDSRAQNGFNGVSPFGKRDPNAFVYENTGSPIFGQPVETQILIKFSSLASQAVGPPGNEFEMSCLNRTLPDVGHKLLFSTPTPLAQQVVSEHDSALGPMSNARFNISNKGLALKYPELIALAFQPRWWDSIRPVVTRNAGRRPQIEANFSLFFGLSVQAYMETLRADRTPLDRFMDDPTFDLSPSQLRGLKLFESSCAVFDVKGQCVKAERPDPPRNPNPKTRVESFLFDNKTPADLRCTTCHGGPETTAARIDAVINDARLERMAQATGAKRSCAIYDAGHFNTGVRPTHEDIALGASDQWGNSFGETQLLKDGLLAKLAPGALAPFGLRPVFGGTTNCDGMNVMGTFKAPQLRNVELTGPYFHNGGQLTLRQVVDFYNRGGDFDNTEEFDPNVHPLHLGDQDKNDLVAFLMALTDERVAYEREPFDHPSICVANGAEGTETGVTIGRALPGDGPAPRAKDNLLCVNAVGANGRSTRLKPFLGVNQFSPTTP